MTISFGKSKTSTPQYKVNAQPIDCFGAESGSLISHSLNAAISRLAIDFNQRLIEDLKLVLQSSNRHWGGGGGGVLRKAIHRKNINQPCL